MAGSNITRQNVAHNLNAAPSEETSGTVSHVERMNLDKRAACADKAHERSVTQNLIATVNTSQNAILQAVTKQLSELTKAWIETKGNHNSKSGNQDLLRQTEVKTASRILLLSPKIQGKGIEVPKGVQHTC